MLSLLGSMLLGTMARRVAFSIVFDLVCVLVAQQRPLCVKLEELDGDDLDDPGVAEVAFPIGVIVEPDMRHLLHNFRRRPWVNAARTDGSKPKMRLTSGLPSRSSVEQSQLKSSTRSNASWEQVHSPGGRLCW